MWSKDSHLTPYTAIVSMKKQKQTRWQKHTQYSLEDTEDPCLLWQLGLVAAPCTLGGDTQHLPVAPLFTLAGPEFQVAKHDRVVANGKRTQRKLVQEACLYFE